jgi:ribonuclease HI
VYTDGSCKHVRDHHLAVAAAAAVQVTDAGTKSLQSAVPIQAPRTAVYAEHLAMCLVHLGVQDTPVEVVSDCQAIIQGFRAAHDWQHDPRNRFAHFWAQVAASIKAVHKVKAHCTPKEAAALGQMQWFAGNAKADELANSALPTFEAGEVDRFLCNQKVIHLHVREACKVLAGYEALNPMCKQLRAAPRTKVPAVRQLRRVHQWQWFPRAAAFVCRLCAATCRKTEIKGLRSACHGKCRFLEGIHRTHHATITARVECPRPALDLLSSLWRLLPAENRQAGKTLCTS